MDLERYLSGVQHGRLVGQRLQHVALWDEVVGAHLVEQAVLQVVNEAQQEAGGEVLLEEEGGGQAVARPEHHAAQVVRAEGLRAREQLDEDRFARLVRLHEAGGDALLQLHLEVT